MKQFIRTETLIGKDNLEKLVRSHVAVFGVGGVGGYVCEALVRSGVSHITIIDKDVVSESNINRQIIATYDTLGMSKVEVMKKRILSINPSCIVDAIEMFYLPEVSHLIDFSKFDYVVDAVDTVTAKLLIVEKCYEAKIPVISSMGTGNKLDPTKFKIADINQTSICPLAKVMRYELRQRGISHLKCLYSTEEIIKTGDRTPASIAFVPSVAGLIIASEVIKDLLK